MTYASVATACLLVAWSGATERVPLSVPSAKSDPGCHMEAKLSTTGDHIQFRCVGKCPVSGSQYPTCSIYQYIDANGDNWAYCYCVGSTTFAPNSQCIGVTKHRSWGYFEVFCQSLLCAGTCPEDYFNEDEGVVGYDVFTNVCPCN